MDYRSPELSELVAALECLLRKHALHDAYLFGSRVRGDYLHRSDLDVIVVDARFRGVPFLDRPLALLRDWPRHLPELQLFVYTPEEFARGNTIIREALKRGLHLRLDQLSATT